MHPRCAAPYIGNHWIFGGTTDNSWNPLPIVCARREWFSNPEIKQLGERACLHCDRINDRANMDGHRRSFCGEGDPNAKLTARRVSLLLDHHHPLMQAPRETRNPVGIRDAH